MADDNSLNARKFALSGDDLGGPRLAAPGHMSKQDAFPVGLVTRRSPSTAPVVIATDGRPRCQRHGMLTVVDDARCMRCVKEDDSRHTRRTLSIVAVIAAGIILTLVGARAFMIGRELAAASATTTASATATNAGEARVVVYTTSSCPYCRKAKAWFDDRQVAYVERNVESDDGAREEWHALGGRSVPLIAIDGQVVQRGYDPSGQQITKSLVERGIDVGPSAEQR